MEVKQNDKCLRHIQSVTEYRDEPVDIFVFSENEPTEEQVRQLVIDDMGCDDCDDEIDDIMEHYNIYTVYAEEL